MQAKYIWKWVALVLMVGLFLTACQDNNDGDEVVPTVSLATDEVTVVPTRVDEPITDVDSDVPTPAGTPITPPTPQLPNLDTLDPAGIDWSPQLIYASPRPGEEVMLNGAITLRFDQPMDEDSVQEAIRVRSEGEDDAEVEVEYEWPRPDTLLITPRANLDRSQQYNVQIDVTASGRNGKQLPAPVNLQFETVGFLAVAQTVPGAGRTAELDSPITVLFNRPVVPIVTTGEQDGLPQPLVIEPAIAGEGMWVSSSIYRFVPDEPLVGGTEYRVSVPAGLTDTTGGLLETDHTWTFTTAPPSVLTIWPPTGNQDVKPTDSFTVTFNTAMDESSVINATTLEPAIGLDYTWSDDQRTVVITPRQPLALATRHTLSIGTSALAAGQSASLANETTSVFFTAPFPAVASVSPRQGESAHPHYGGINIEFNTPIDLDTIEGHVSIQPEPEEVTYRLYSATFVSVEFDMERGVSYTASISGDVADPYGNTLGEAYTWQFSVAPPSPLASFNLPFGVAQLTNSHPSKVTIVHRNVTQMDVALYDAGLLLRPLINPYEVRETNLADLTIQREWDFTLDLPEDIAHDTTISLNEGEALPTGVYLLRLSSPQTSENDSFWQNQHQMLVVADTNVVVKQMPDEVRVWVTDLETGLPAPGRELTLYANLGARFLATATSDSNGFARFDFIPTQPYLEGVTVVSNAPGEAGFGIAGSKWNEGAQPWQFDIPISSNRDRAQLAYIHTDRPIYRPGDTIYFRGILREADYGRYTLPTPGTVEINIESFNLGFGEVENDPFNETINVNIDALGLFSGEFTIPAEAAVGRYRLHFADEDGIAKGFRLLEVANYRAPEFQVSVTPSRPEVTRGEMVEVTISAGYFFGGPASDLPVTYDLYERVHQFESERRYRFDDGDAFFYSPSSSSEGYYGDWLASGSGQTDSNGEFTFTIPADLLDEVEAGSRVLTIDASIADLSEFLIAATGEVVFHSAESYVGVVPTDYLNVTGDPAGVDLITLDWNDQPQSNIPVELIVYQRDYEFVQERLFGGLFTRYEPIDTEIDRFTVTTDEFGKAQASFVPPQGGTYRAVATLTDSAGRTHTSATFLWASDSDYIAWRTNPEERRMELIPDQQSYEVGDTARVLVQSPFEGSVQAWLTVERGNLLDQWLVTLDGNSDTVEIPITPDMAPNVFISLVAVKGTDGATPYADIRLGITELVVNPEQLALDVSLTPRGDVFEPGESVTYDINVTDYAGQPVEADLSLALVDLAVLTLKEDNAPPIAEAFYSRQPYRSEIGSGLFISGEGLEVNVPNEPGGFGGGGGGGGDARISAEGLDDDVRRDFPDTAFWRASVRTNSNGQASVTIPFPDSTTTWRLSSKAVSDETLVGETQVDIVATLPLLLRPVTPRFFTVGDVVYLGTIVNNNTDESLDVTVSLEADGVRLDDEAEQVVTVSANSQELVRWTVTVLDAEFADLTFRAEAGELRDATKPTFGIVPDQLIPIYRYNAEDLVGSSGVVDAGRAVEAVLLPSALDPDLGAVHVQLTPSLAGSLFETLTYVDNVNFAQSCAHSTMHQLLPNVALAFALQELAVVDEALQEWVDGVVPAGIDRLAELQKITGGWGWCYSDQTDPYLTAYILFGLAKAEEAGYDISDIRLESALNSLDIRTVDRISSAYLANRQAFNLFVLASHEAVEREQLDELVEDHRELLDPYAKAYVALAYEAVEHDGTYQADLLSDLNGAAVLSAAGAFWQDESDDYRNLSSDVRGTAVVLSALSQLEPGNALAPQAVRWLMSARTADHWPTVFETVWSTLALTDWMVASGELEADFAYALAVNGVELLAGQFDESNVTSTEELSVEISRLPSDSITFFDFQRDDGSGQLYYTLQVDAFVPADSVAAVSRGVTVQRAYYSASCNPLEDVCEAIGSLPAGEQVRVELTIIAHDDLTYVQIDDPIPAGAEPLDPNLDTTSAQFGTGFQRTDQTYQYGYWGWWFFERVQFDDEAVRFYAQFLPAGTYQYTYYLQTTIPGTYQVMPAVARQEFFPDVFGRSDGLIFVIE